MSGAKNLFRGLTGKWHAAILILIVSRILNSFTSCCSTYKASLESKNPQWVSHWYRVLLRWCNHGMTSHSLCQRLLASTTSQALSRLHEENHLLGEAPRGSGSGRPLTVSRTPEYLWLCWGRYDWDKFPVFPFAYLFSGCYVFYNSLYGKFSMPWQAIYSQIYLRTKVANFRDAVIPVETTIYVWI